MRDEIFMASIIADIFRRGYFHGRDSQSRWASNACMEELFVGGVSCPWKLLGGAFGSERGTFFSFGLLSIFGYFLIHGLRGRKANW